MTRTAFIVATGITSALAMATIYNALQDDGSWMAYGTVLFLPHLVVVLGLTEVPAVKQFGGRPIIVVILWVATLPVSALYVLAADRLVRWSRSAESN